MTTTSSLNRFLRRTLGIELHKTKASFNEARLHVINSKQVTLLLDGGANEGQWASRVRRDGYQGRIISVEPGSKAFSKLEASSRGDESWEVLKLALGSNDGISKLYLSSNDGMSSSLKQPSRHLIDFPTVSFAGSEEVSVTTLETLLTDLDENVLVKLDIQGFELEALEGIGKALQKVVAIEIEMTLLPMYQGEASVGRTLVAIENMGFELFTISEFGKGKHGQVSYFDVIAVKAE